MTQPYEGTKVSVQEQVNESEAASPACPHPCDCGKPDICYPNSIPPREAQLWRTIREKDAEIRRLTDLLLHRNMLGGGGGPAQQGVFLPTVFPVTPPLTPPQNCSLCGLKLEGVMCYVCPNGQCPCGLGGAQC